MRSFGVVVPRAGMRWVGVIGPRHNQPPIDLILCTCFLPSMYLSFSVIIMNTLCTSSIDILLAYSLAFSQPIWAISH